MRKKLNLKEIVIYNYKVSILNIDFFFIKDIYLAVYTQTSPQQSDLELSKMFIFFHNVIPSVDAKISWICLACLIYKGILWEIVDDDHNTQTF